MTRTKADNHPNSVPGWLNACVGGLLVLTLMVNLLSAFIRLQEAGVGCSPWPQCYARLAEIPQEADASPLAALTPAAAAKQAHRGLATALVVLLLIVISQVNRMRLSPPAAYLPYGIAGTVLLLAVIGPASYLKTLPLIATTNLVGGMLLLGLTWLLWLSLNPARQALPRSLGRLAHWALLATVTQIALGAWVSANFAVAACSMPFVCATPEAADLAGFWPLRELSVDPSGQVVMTGAQGLIQMTHHGLAVLVAALLAVLGMRCLGSGAVARRWGGALLGLLAVQLSVGGLGVVFGMPLALAVAHNGVAAGLLLAVLRLRMLAPSGR